jgi:hypothetical protein
MHDVMKDAPMIDHGTLTVQGILKGEEKCSSKQGRITSVLNHPLPLHPPLLPHQQMATHSLFRHHLLRVVENVELWAYNRVGYL